MSVVVPPLSPERSQRDLRQRVADVLFAALVWYGKRARRLRAWLSSRRQEELGLARGGLIVIFTNHEDARARALAAIDLAVKRIEPVGRVHLIRVREMDEVVPSQEKAPRWGVEPRHKPEPFVRRGLTRSYAGVATEPGLESVVRLAVRLAAWRSRLPNSRRGLVVTYSPLVVPAHPPMPVGEIVFSPEYAAAKALVGADNVDSHGVTIMVIDIHPPDLAKLEELDPTIAKRVTVLPPHGPVADGHATLMTAVVGDIARDARILAVALSEPGAESDTAFALIDVLNNELGDVDLIVASVSFADATKTRAERGRDSSLVGAFTGRRSEPRRPPALFPTGNLDSGMTVDSLARLAVPARFEGNIGIGSVAVAPGGQLVRRSEGSRYGEKEGGAPSAWWLAPGGSFRRVGDVDAFVTVGGHSHAGTSIANAFAGGLLAGVVSRLRQQGSTPTPKVEANVRRINETLANTPSSDQSQVTFATLGTAYTGTVTFDRLAAECARLARREMVEGYVRFQHGGGVLRLDEGSGAQSAAIPWRG